MIQEILSIYSILVTDLKKIQTVIEKLFPDNTGVLIEKGTVFLSDGEIFECSVEPRSNAYLERFYLSATYKGDQVSFDYFLSNLIFEFEKNEIVYNIDSEFREGDGYFEKNIRHPDYDRL